MQDTLISCYEKNFVIDSIHDGVRNDGRSLIEYRPICLDTGVLCGTNGSSRVRIGGTDVLTGVKAELASAEKEDITKRLRFSVELSPVAATTVPKGDFCEELAEALAVAYSHPFALPDIYKKFVLSKTQAWILFVDVVVLQLDGAAADAISLGVKTALADTRICEVICRPADEGKTMIDIPQETTTWTMDISRAPLIIGINKIGDYSVVDPTLIEEQSSTSALAIALLPPCCPSSDENSNKTVSSSGISTTEKSETANDQEYLLAAVKKFRGGTLDMDSIGEMTTKAVAAAKTLDAKLHEWLRLKAAKSGVGQMLVSDSSVFAH